MPKMLMTTQPFAALICFMFSSIAFGEFPGLTLPAKRVSKKRMRSFAKQRYTIAGLEFVNAHVERLDPTVKIKNLLGIQSDRYVS